MKKEQQQIFDKHTIFFQIIAERRKRKPTQIQIQNKANAKKYYQNYYYINYYIQNIYGHAYVLTQKKLYFLSITKCIQGVPKCVDGNEVITQRKGGFFDNTYSMKI